MQFRFAWLPLLAACADDDRTVVEIVEIGVIDHASAGPSVIGPAYAIVGESFDLTVPTHGTYGCVAYERTDVLITSDAVDLTPYDRREPSCGDELLRAIIIRHTAPIVFTSSGTKMIRVYGTKRTFRLEVSLSVQQPGEPSGQCRVDATGVELCGREEPDR